MTAINSHLKGKKFTIPIHFTVFSNLEYGNYWIQSGQPTLLYEQLKKFNVNLENVFESECSLDSLKGFDLDDPNPCHFSIRPAISP